MEAEVVGQTPPVGPVLHVTVILNEHEVVFTVRKATGLEIKSAAIAQGVQIKADFVLFEVTGNHLKPIGDSEVVELRDKQVFRATAPDDQS